MFRSDFSKYEICSESLTKTLYGQAFGKWMHFQIILSLWELEICYACIAEESLNILLLLLILKSSNQNWSVKKGALKRFRKFYWKPLVLDSLQACNILQKRLWHRCIAVKFTKFLRAPFLKSICEPLHASVSS